MAIRTSLTEDLAKNLRHADEPAGVEKGRNWLQSFDAAVRSRSEWIAATVVAAGFCWRLWLSHATFFNTDEAWHALAANQDSLSAAYHASLSLSHPPLLVLVLSFWRHLGTSDWMLRLPGVLSGTVFCWVFYKWLVRLFGRTVALTGLFFAAFLPPMIALSAELRQYSPMLMFAVISAYLLENALDADSVKFLLVSFACLYLAMLTHYSAFLFAAVLGVYAILRMIVQRPAISVLLGWAAGQVVGVGLGWILYATHISKLGSVYPGAQPLHQYADFYLSDWYFHPDRDRLVPFLYRGTFGIFRFIFGHTAVAQIAVLMFLVGIAGLLFPRKLLREQTRPRLMAALLLIPFALSWMAVAAGLYPYGRTRQCVILAVFVLAGVSLGLANIVRDRIAISSALALVFVAICQAFGTPQGRDMLPLTDQRRAHMDQALEFIRNEASSRDVIFTDKATSLQLRHYLCRREPIGSAPAGDGLEAFHCEGLRVISTGPNDGALTAESLADRWKDWSGNNALGAANQIWVVQTGWAHGLGEDLRRQYPTLGGIEIHSFGRYIEVLRMPPNRPSQQ